MKTNLLMLAACASLLSTAACSNENATTTTDSAMSADSTNAMDADTTGSMDMGMAAPADTATAPHATDDEFMKSAAHSDQNEIQLSKLVLDKGVTGMAKDHANQMITDHTKSTAELKPIAQKKKVTLPTDMDADHKAIAASMKQLSGKELETKYMEQMVMDHQKTLNTMQAHQKMTKDADLQGFIGKTTPVVQNHLTMFKQHATTM